MLKKVLKVYNNESYAMTICQDSHPKSPPRSRAGIFTDEKNTELTFMSYLGTSSGPQPTDHRKELLNDVTEQSTRGFCERFIFSPTQDMLAVASWDKKKVRIYDIDL